MEYQFYGGICGYVALFLFKLNWDRNQRLDGKIINHLLESILIYPFVFICCIAIARGTGVDVSNAWLYFYYIAVSTGMGGFIWWTFFDGLYNLWNPNGRQAFFFAGSEDGKYDSWFDNILQKMNYWQRAVLKLSGCVIFTVWYILIN